MNVAMLHQVGSLFCHQLSKHVLVSDTLLGVQCGLYFGSHSYSHKNEDASVQCPHGHSDQYLHRENTTTGINSKNNNNNNNNKKAKHTQKS